MNITAKNFKLITIFVLILNSITFSSWANVMLDLGTSFGCIDYIPAELTHANHYYPNPSYKKQSKDSSHGVKIGIGSHSNIGKLRLGFGLDAKMQLVENNSSFDGNTRLHSSHKYQSLLANIFLGLDISRNLTVYAKAKYGKMKVKKRIQLDQQGKQNTATMNSMHSMESLHNLLNTIGFAGGVQLAVNKNLYVYLEGEYEKSIDKLELRSDVYETPNSIIHEFHSVFPKVTTLNIGLRYYV